MPRWLHRLLFDATVVDARLPAEVAERYRVATRYAARYCRALERRFLATGARGLGTELRRFYRMDRSAKLGFIESVA